MSEHPKVPQQLSDPISENLQKLAALFPAAVKDGELDIEALREELGDFAEIQPGDEKYELNWVGKQAAKKKTFEPLLGKTLALKDDGKNTETTENLYIEGDNLEALKLLRQNYYGEVKMIYIDPPYNTGKDFVYTDKFKVSQDESEAEEGAVSESGERLVKNEKSSNRFHARWLDMIYPRLRLAKDLLKEDGVIFISIGEDEISNLKQVCDELFDTFNFIGLVTRAQKGGGNKGTHYNPVTDYILTYSKNIHSLPTFTEKVDLSIYNKTETSGPRSGEKYAEVVIYMPNLDPMRGCKNQRYYVECPDGSLAIPPGDVFPEEQCDGSGIPPTSGDDKVWRWTYGTFSRNKKEGRVAFKRSKRTKLVKPDGTKSDWILYQKRYYSEAIEQETARPNNLFLNYQNMIGSKELENLSIPFDYPKPSELIKHLAFISKTRKNDLILDFYSGSSSTAAAVMQLNSEDCGSRKYIMVQLPEVCEPKSKAAKASYKTIAEIGKERIRRAGDKIVAELRAKKAELEKKGELKLDDNKESNPYILNPDALDIGFKSFRIEDTKINWLKKDLRGEEFDFDTADISDKDALDFVPGTTDYDVVYELMLRQSNIPLTLPITQPVPTANRTYLYGDAYLICLEEEISNTLVASLAALEPTPLKYFFRDSAFGKDIAFKDETCRRLNAEIAKNTADQADAYTVEFI